MFEKETERAYYTFSEIQEIKKYYIFQIVYWQLAFIAIAVIAFLIGLSV